MHKLYNVAITMKGYEMNKRIKNMQWHTKLILLGLALILLLNPLSLIVLSSGIDITVVFIGDMLQQAIEFGTEYTLYPMGLGALLMVLGGGMYLGAREKNEVKRLESLKTRPTLKAGKPIETN